MQPTRGGERDRGCSGTENCFFVQLKTATMNMGRRGLFLEEYSDDELQEIEHGEDTEPAADTGKRRPSNGRYIFSISKPCPPCKYREYSDEERARRDQHGEDTEPAADTGNRRTSNERYRSSPIIQRYLSKRRDDLLRFRRNIPANPGPPTASSAPPAASTSAAQVKGGTALIETQQSVTVEIGGDAHLSCGFVEARDVVQVNFLKCSPQGEERLLASYNKESSKTVEPDLEDKVDLIEDTVQNTSIILKNITVKDKGCYRCVYETSSRKKFIKDTCLQVYELQKPVLHVEGSPEKPVKMSVVPEHVQLLYNSSINNSSFPVNNTTNNMALLSVTVIVPIVFCICAAVLHIKRWLKRNRGNRN